jgi:prepilin signal peptidase PulO-like enzyme (type II secretory pathway)
VTGTAITFISLFGLAIGSFLNVVIYRFNTGRGVNGRSMCMTCSRTLSWYELIPVVSFIIQGGRCRGCNTKLSWQYPLVELLTAGLFTATFLKFQSMPWTAQTFIMFIMMLVVWSILVVILVYDLKHKIIPDSLVYSFAAIGLLRILLFVPFQNNSVFFSSFIAGPALFLPFYILWLISDGRWIGLGDGKFALGMGWMLGLGFGVSAVVLSFWIGAVISILIMGVLALISKSKQLTMKSEIPFAPYLILGFTIVYFFSIDVMGLQSMFHI